MIRFLSETIILAIHDDQVRLYGGSYGIRDAAALDSAIQTPKAQFGGQFLHESIFHMAAAYGFHLNQNQPFIDGNKRTSGMVMLTFLALNGLEITATENDYYEAVMAVSTGRMNKEQLADWLRSVTRGDEPGLT